MKKELYSYINAQMIRVMPFPLDSGMNGQVRIKMQSDHGASNWMLITADQAKQIERILEGA